MLKLFLLCGYSASCPVLTQVLFMLENLLVDGYSLFRITKMLVDFLKCWPRSWIIILTIFDSFEVLIGTF